MQAVAAAEGDDLVVAEWRPRHSRPRSRWVARASYPRSTQPAGDLLGHRDAAVLAAGAADGDGHEPLALVEVALADAVEHGEVRVEELGGAGPGS